MRERRVYEPNEMCLMVVADRIAGVFVEQIRRLGGALDEMGNGLRQGHLGGLPLHAVELREAYKTAPSERLLYAFTRAFLSDHGPIKLLDNDELEVYRMLVDHIQQLKSHRATTDMKHLKLAQKSYEEALNALIAIARPEQRLAGLAPEQRLAGLAPEQVLFSLPDDLLRAFSPDYVATLPASTRDAIRARIGR